VPSEDALVATSYSLYGVVPTDTAEDKPVNVVTAVAAVPHSSAVSKIRILLDEAKRKPVSCSVHVSVSEHSVAPTKTPFIVNVPTSYTYSAAVKTDGENAQHKVYKLPAVPAVAVVKAYSS
jgi:hypothetical protein